MSKAADEYQYSGQPIPAEARWQISLVEGGIKTTKGMMETLVGDYPELELEELLGRAVWVMNSRDLFKGFAPVQHAVGRYAGEHDDLFDDTLVQPV